MAATNFPSRANFLLVAITPSMGTAIDFSLAIIEKFADADVVENVKITLKVEHVLDAHLTLHIPIHIPMHE